MSDATSKQPEPRSRRTPRPARRRLPLWKRALFIGVTLSLPLAAVGLVELSLRLAGFGGYPPVFKPVGTVGDRALVITENEGASSFFYATRSRPGSLMQEAFLSPKPEGTARVLLVGASAIKGYPQPRAFSTGSFLEELLEGAWPDRDVEVLNLGVTAIASFPVLEILREGLAYEPDAVVIYSGHNEFFGAYGVASLHSAGRTPAMIAFQRRLRSLATSQALSRLTDRSAGSDDKALIEVMAAQGFVGPSDPSRAAAARNLGAHVGAMIDLCDGAGVPVIVCTLPVNERGMAPVGEDRAPGPGVDAARFGAVTALGPEDVASRPTSLGPEIEWAAGAAPEHARAAWLLATLRGAQGRHEDAAALFRRAVDLDPMPWRATSAQNDAIREAAASRGAVLCDAEARFRADAPGGSVGWALMDDHVHMSLRGQWLLADAVFRSMAGLPGGAGVSEAAVAAAPGFDELAARLGDNEFTRYGVAHTMRALFNVPFFMETNAHAFERFDRAARRFEATLTPEERDQARRWQDPKSHPGMRRPIAGMIGKLRARQGRHAEAATLLASALRSVAAYSSWSVEYTFVRLLALRSANGSLSEAEVAEGRAALERGRVLLENGTTNTGQTERFTGRLAQLLGDWEGAIPYLNAARDRVTGMDLVATDIALLESLARVGRLDEAERLIEHGAANAGEFAVYYERARERLAAIRGAPGAGGADAP